MKNLSNKKVIKNGKTAIIHKISTCKKNVYDYYVTCINTGMFGCQFIIDNKYKGFSTNKEALNYANQFINND